MQPFDESTIRACFVNASKGEAKRASVPDLAGVRWESIDYLGWIDEKREQLGYVVLDVDGQAAGMLLRRTPPTRDRRRLMCSWCQDITATDEVTMWVAPRAGASGRAGNTVGTAICTDFSCSAHVRRPPTALELQDPDARAWWTRTRIDELARRSRHFLDVVRQEAAPNEP